MEDRIERLNGNRPAARRVERLSAVAASLGVHTTTLRRWTGPDYAHLNFPKPIILGDGSKGFVAAEIDEWVASRPRAGVAA